MTVRPISEHEHLDFLRGQRSASFLQTPAWGRVKSEWKRESLGWFGARGELTGVGLVLYRRLPKLKKYLAYLPEGPVIDWESDGLAAWLDPMVAHLKKQGAFGVRMGPPVVTARWSAAQVKDGIASDDVRRLGDLPPSERSQSGAQVVSQLHELGWKRQGTDDGFAAGQPQYNFQIPLVSTSSTDEAARPTKTARPTKALERRRDTPLERAPRTEEDLLKGMNQQWRRNIKKAAKEGVEVTVGDPGADLKLFHDLYAHTAERDHFTPRPLAYFRTMFDALLEEEPDRIRLYLARHDGDLVASTIAIRVGAHAWYSYGASSTEKREVRGSNGIQWAMIQDALAAGADVYDLRGITDTLDPNDSHVGLIQFKVGTGGEAVEYAGEWDLPINRPLYKAFELYMKRR